MLAGFSQELEQSSLTLNTNPACCKLNDRASRGVMVRDSEGRLVTTWTAPQNTCSEPSLEELLAIRSSAILTLLLSNHNLYLT